MGLRRKRRAAASRIARGDWIAPADRIALGGWTAAALAALGALAPAGLTAQAAVRSASMAVELSEGGAAVSVTYEIGVDGPLDSVEVALLERPGATGGEVRDGRGRPVYLASAAPLRRTASLALPAARDGVARLAFDYDVPRAVTVDGGRVLARVPVLSVSLPPASDLGDVFTATVRVPTDWSVAEGFPSALRSVEPGVWRASLPVVPSMVSVRGRTDGRWRPGVDLLVEALTAAVLLGFGLVGWRHMEARS